MQAPDWPGFRPIRPRPRIDRRHDPVYRRLREECEARERARHAAPAPRHAADPRPDESAQIELERAELAAWVRRRCQISAAICETEGESHES